MDITTLYTNWTTYIWGNPVLGMLGFMFIVTMIGVKYRWPFESYVMVFVPLLLSVFGGFIVPGVEPLVLMGLGLIIGFGLLALIRR